MADVNDAVRQFDATEANLVRLESFWKQIEGLIPQGMVIDTSSPNAIRYADVCRAFRHILKAMPKIGGKGLEDRLLDLDDMFQMRLDAAEVQEIAAQVTVERTIVAQAECLQDYRFRFASQRRALVRTSLKNCIGEVDRVLIRLGQQIPSQNDKKMEGADWDRLKDLLAQIDVLRGSAISVPTRWEHLRRHLWFGLAGDLNDIINHDWPAARQSLQSAMYGPEDPLPVDVTDLADVVREAPSGPIATSLRWEVLDDADFERLIYNLFAGAEGYTDPQWLTHPNAPDRGRDLSVSKSIKDSLSGTRSFRVIVQCKHWLAKAVGMKEVAVLVNHMQSWEPPKVDELIIATSGRFTSDTVAWVEKHNFERKTPQITMWPSSHLESLLAARPHLVAEFHLR